MWCKNVIRLILKCTYYYKIQVASSKYRWQFVLKLFYNFKSTRASRVVAPIGKTDKSMYRSWATFWHAYGYDSLIDESLWWRDSFLVDLSQMRKPWFLSLFAQGCFPFRSLIWMMMILKYLEYHEGWHPFSKRGHISVVCRYDKCLNRKVNFG